MGAWDFVLPPRKCFSFSLVLGSHSCVTHFRRGILEYRVVSSFKKRTCVSSKPSLLSACHPQLEARSVGLSSRVQPYSFSLALTVSSVEDCCLCLGQQDGSSKGLFTPSTPTSMTPASDALTHPAPPHLRPDSGLYTLKHSLKPRVVAHTYNRWTWR